MDLLEHISQWSREGRRGALVTVLHTQGSTPRHAGSMMLVDTLGEIYSTIGGGRVEYEVIQKAKAIAAGQEDAQKVTHHLVRDLAMCCGGTMTFWIEALDEHQSLFETLGERMALRQDSWVETRFQTGKKSILDVAPSHAIQKEESNTSFVHHFSPPRRLVLLGAGHVAQALGPMAHQCSFQVVLCDDNATAELDVARDWVSDSVASFKLHDIESQLKGLASNDHVIIMTRDHGVDEDALASLLPKAHSLAYLGLIGSLGKLGRFRKRLESKGFDSGWDALHCPIGLDIGAETPSEIAVSVMAELITQVSHKATRV